MASLTPSNYTTIQMLPEEQKFNGENYVSFKAIMLPTGRLKGLNLYWEGRVNNPLNAPSPYPATAPAAPTTVNDPNPSPLEYELRESVAYLTLWNNIKNPDGLGIPHGMSSRKLWEYLEKEFQTVTSIARQRKEDNLRTCRYVEGTKIAGEGGYAEKMRLLLKEANDCGAAISASQFNTIFLDSFPRNPTWSVVTGNLMGETSFNVIVSRLEEYYLHLGPSSTGVSVNPGDRVSALQAEVNQLKAALAASTGQHRGPANPDLICINSNCKGRGHTIENCWKLGGGKQGQYPKWWKGKRDAPLVNPSANTATESVNEGGAITTGNIYALSAIACAAITTANPPNGPARTFADSGATAHFFHDRSVFRNYTEKKGTVGNSSKKGVSFEIVGQGDVDVRIIHNNIAHILTFRNALHAPSIASNLISVGVLDTLGWIMTIGHGKIVFCEPGGSEVFMGCLSSGLYLIEGSFTGVHPTALAARSLHSPGDGNLWHRRFGHAGITRISQAVSLLNGLEIKKGDILRCEDCTMANHKRRPFDGDTGDEKDPLECVYLDIFGPTRVVSVGGHTYAMLLVDGGTARKIPYFLSNRTAETTLEVVNNFKVTAERQTGHKLKRLRTDNAPEFRAQIWVVWFQTHGIIHEFTAAYSSASNGVAERGIGVLTEATRAMLLDARLGGRWWCEAYAAAAYVGNLLPSARHPGEIPEEKWTSKRQDVTHLRVWGCVCYVKIPVEKGISKLESRSIKCQFIGYEAPGIYRCKVMGSDEVVRSRDVIFEEGSGHWTSLTEGETEEDMDVSFLNVPVSKSENGSGDLNQPPTNSVVEPGRTEETTLINNNQVTPHSSPPRDPPPAPRRLRQKTPVEPTRRSTRIRNLTQAMMDSRAYQEEEQQARVQGESWAGDWKAGESPLLPEFDEEEERESALIAQNEPLAPEPDNKWVPLTYAEASSRLDLWGPALDKEIGRLDEKKAFIPVPREDWMKLIGTRMVFDVVTNQEGKVVKRRVRLVAQGHTQKKGIHYFESFSLTARYESIRLVIALAAYYGLELWAGDFAAAYLNAKPQATNYLRIPDGYEKHYGLRDGRETVLRQEINLYGTKDAGHNWYRLLDKTYRELGHQSISADPCVRYRATEKGETITTTYTDDVMGASSTSADGEGVQKELGDKFEFRRDGKPDTCLGIGLEYHENGDISIHQHSLITSTLERFEMVSCAPKYTPLSPGLDLYNSQPTPISPEDYQFMSNKDYMGLLGCLNHIAQGTRPDIAYAVSLLQRFSSDPRPIHWSAAQHVLAYLSATIHYKLTYRYRGNLEGQEESLKLIGYCDASHADVREEHGAATRKSTMGYVFLIGGAAVSWSSKKQSVVALSTTEAEYLSMVHAGKQAIWMSNFLKSVNRALEGVPEIRVDNLSAVALTQTTTHHARTKHFDVNWAWIRDTVREGEVTFNYVPSASNLADILTKSLPRPAVMEITQGLGLVE